MSPCTFLFSFQKPKILLFSRNPTPNDDNLFSNMSWPSFSIKDKLLLNIDHDMTVQPFNNDNGAFQLWDAIYQCMYYVKCDEIMEYLYNKKIIVF